MRIAVTGSRGQVAMSLIERAKPDIEIAPLSRPAFALEVRRAVLAAIETARPDVVNAAAYTAVDKAEAEEELAVRLNGEGAGHLAEAAAKIGAPLLHLSTDYVFDGALDRPYREDDPTAPTGAYGRSKRIGERLVGERPNSAILRTAWVYCPVGANFVRTMLRLNETREEVGVVADQRGNPTSALDVADALLAIAQRIREDASPTLRGAFHMTGLGDATWGRFGRGGLPGGRRARAASHPRQADHDRRLSHAGAPPGQFSPRQRKAPARLWPRFAGLARVARSLLIS
jgi:dTDP-4-dehydrorhamnose reductase